MARPDDPDVTPVLREQDPAALAQAIAGSGRLVVHLDGQPITRAMPEGAAAIIALADGDRSLAEIRAQLGLDPAAFTNRFEALYRALNGVNLMLLRRPVR